MKEQEIFIHRFAANIRKLLSDAVKTSYDLFKIIVPISILTKLLSEAGVIDYLGFALSPVMQLVGLPGSMGLVWATSMLTNLYGGMVVFASLAPEAHLTIAQVTVLTTMMLVAHSLPVELRIVQKAGARFRFMIFLRIVGALTLGWLLHQIYTLRGALQTPNRLLWNPSPQDSSWLAWAQGEVRNFLSIFLIIFVLLFIMKVLKRFGVISLLTKLLDPILSALGMSRAAAPVTIIGLTLGLSYGGGLIIQEVQSGNTLKYDIFSSLALMSLSHSLIEDTLVMMVLGGDLSGILWGRLLFSFLVVFLLGKLLRKIPEKVFDRYFFRTSFCN